MDLIVEIFKNGELRTDQKNLQILKLFKKNLGHMFECFIIFSHLNYISTNKLVA